MSHVPAYHRPHLAASYEEAASVAAWFIREGIKVQDASRACGLALSAEAKNWGQFIMRLANHTHQQERRRAKEAAR